LVQNNWQICILYSTPLQSELQDLCVEKPSFFSSLGNVFEWKDMSTCRLLFQWASPIKNYLSMLVWVQSEHHHFIEFNLFSLWYSLKMFCKKKNLVQNNWQICILYSTPLQSELQDLCVEKPSFFSSFKWVNDCCQKPNDNF
jgi:hypothetical protein